MRKVEEKEEKKQGQVGKKKENQFRKLSWRALPGEGQWVFILHTLAGLKHFIWDKHSTYFHTNDIILLSVWHFDFTYFWNKFVVTLCPGGGGKPGVYLMDANLCFQLWRHHRKGSSFYPRKGWHEALGAHSWQEPQGSPAGAGGSRSWHRSAQAPHVLVRN